MPYKDIGSYGAIGNMHSAALVGLDGSIDWCCMPRIDSPSVFAAILDDERGGSFQIAPLGLYESTQRYLPETNILETTFVTATGAVTLTDFMPLAAVRGVDVLPQDIHRIVECVEGSVVMRAVFRPRFDYARAFTSLELMRYGVLATSGPHEMSLSVNVPITLNGDAAESRFTMEPGRRAVLVVSLRQKASRWSWARAVARSASNAPPWPGARWWKRLHYDGLWRDEVVRSFLTPAPPHLLPHRRHRRGAHNVAAGAHRRRAQLGLPFLLAARLRLHPRSALPPRRPARRPPLPQLAPGQVRPLPRRGPPAGALRPEGRRQHSGIVPRSPGRIPRVPARAHWQRCGLPAPAGHLWRGAAQHQHLPPLRRVHLCGDMVHRECLRGDRLPPLARAGPQHLGGARS